VNELKTGSPAYIGYVLLGFAALGVVFMGGLALGQKPPLPVILIGVAPALNLLGGVLVLRARPPATWAPPALVAFVLMAVVTRLPL
jgi:hypothetical protein